MELIDKKEIINMIEFREQIKKRQHEKQEYEVAELICLGCLKRWIGVYPTKSLLKDGECECGAVGLIIKTGQTIEEEL